AEVVTYNRSYHTNNNFSRVQASVTPNALQAAAKKYVTNENLVITTLWKGAGLSEGQALLPVPPSQEAGQAGVPVLHLITQKTVLPQVEAKLLFNVGSANDPAGKEGLSMLAADMIADAGSRSMTIDAIRKALYPMAGSFGSHVDKEMTTLTASIHRDNWDKFFDIVLPQLVEPGFRDDDFQRLK